MRIVKALFGSVIPLIGVSLACSAAFAAKAESAETRVVVVVDGIKQIRNLPAIVAESLGYFKDEGLTVTLTELRDEIPTDQMLMDGRADAAMAFYHHTFMSQAAGKLTETVITLGVSPALKVLVASRLKDQIKTIADLKGKRIYTGGLNSGKTTTANWLMVKAGNHVTDYTRLELTDRDKMAKALQDGDADVVVAHEPDATYYQTSGVAVLLADVTSVEGTHKSLGSLFPTTSLYLATSYVSSHQDTVQHLVNALVRGLNFINTHTPQEIMAILPKEVAGKHAATYLQDLSQDVKMFATNGLMPEQDARMELKIMAEFNRNTKQSNSKKPTQTSLSKRL